MPENEGASAPSAVSCTRDAAALSPAASLRSVASLSSLTPLCATCGVEAADPLPSVCPICDDERQFVPAGGQEWTTVRELAESGRTIEIAEVEPGLHSLRTQPRTGIGQTCYLATASGFAASGFAASGTGIAASGAGMAAAVSGTGGANRTGAAVRRGGLLFDVPPYIDDDAVEAVAALGGVAAIVASHPHMYGLQLEWSRAFDDAPVYVSRADVRWVQRPGPAIQLYDDEEEVVPGIRVRQVGGHFPGSSVALWRSPVDDALVLLGSDSIAPVARQGWVTFMRSFPNYLPLSARAVRRIAQRVSHLDTERIQGSFGQRLESGGAQAIAQSAERYAAWVSGAHDDLV